MHKTVKFLKGHSQGQQQFNFSASCDRSQSGVRF